MSGNSVINTSLKSLIAQDSSNINNRKLSFDHGASLDR